MNTEKRRDGDARRRGRSLGRRAKHDDSREVREREYKPPQKVGCGLYSRSRTSRQAAFGGQSNGRQPVLSASLGPSVRLRFSVPPCEPVSSVLSGSPHKR